MFVSLPSEYHLFICDISGTHAPICVFVLSTPFPNFACQQRFDDHGWHRLDGQVLGSEKSPLRYTIYSIKHVIKVQDGKNIMQTALNLEPYKGPRSPAFIEPEIMTWSQALDAHRGA